MYICIFGRDPNDACRKSVIFITLLCFIVRLLSSKLVYVCVCEKKRFPLYLLSALEIVEKTGRCIFVISIFSFLCLLLLFYFIIHRRTTYVCEVWEVREKSKIKIPNTILYMRTWLHKTSCVYDATDPRKCSYAVPAEPSGTRRLSTERFVGKTLYLPRMRLNFSTETSFFSF